MSRLSFYYLVPVNIEKFQFKTQKIKTKCSKTYIVKVPKRFVTNQFNQYLITLTSHITISKRHYHYYIMDVLKFIHSLPYKTSQYFIANFNNLSVPREVILTSRNSVLEISIANHFSSSCKPSSKC